MRRLRDKLVLSYAALVFIVVGLTLLVVSRTTLDTLRQALREEIALSSAPFEYTQDPMFRLRRAVVRQIAEDPALNETRIRDRATFLDQASGVASTAGLDLLIITDEAGKILLELENGEDAEKTGQSLAGLPLVARVLHGRPLAGYATFNDGVLFACAAGPLFKGDYVDGVVLVGRRVNAEALKSLSHATFDSGVCVTAKDQTIAAFLPQFGESGQPDGGFTADFAAFLGAWKPPEVTPAKKGEEVRLDPIQFSAGGQEWLALPHPLWDAAEPKPAAWIWFMKPTDELLARVRQQQVIIAAIGVGALLIAIVLGNLFSKRLSRPIESLSEKMRRVGAGDLTQEAHVEGRDEVAHLSSSFNDMVTGLRQKELLKKFVPQGARSAIDESVHGIARLGGQRVRLSALFSDLRGFTTLSEKLDAEQVVSILNEYLECMIDSIHIHHGDISDYIGDAILAVFHSTDEANSSQFAVRAAMQMQSDLDALRQRTGNPHLAGLRMGIGINTGVAVEGNIGAEDRMKFTVVGDTINVASRIQDRSKESKHTCVLVSQETFDELGQEFDADFMGNEMLKGKATPVGIWEIIGVREAAAAQQTGGTA
ncbi:MAG: HAMP domain-containing protein [Armatimonadetes bacterium]|nr:HAMP domain-containing protein [Armatimonadota bacterium]